MNSIPEISSQFVDVRIPQYILLLCHIFFYDRLIRKSEIKKRMILNAKISKCVLHTYINSFIYT